MIKLTGYLLKWFGCFMLYGVVWEILFDNAGFIKKPEE